MHVLILQAYCSTLKCWCCKYVFVLLISLSRRRSSARISCLMIILPRWWKKKNTLTYQNKMKCWTQILESWGANNVMWSQWFFFWFSIWHVYVEAFREYHKCFELQILNLIDRKMQKSSWTPAWNACMIVCVRCGVGPGARRFCSHSVWSIPTLVCPRRSVQICSNGRCYYLLTLHWVSSTPHTANRRETTPSMEGRWWQFMCTCLLKDLMDLCFYFCKKIIYLIVAFIVE